MSNELICWILLIMLFVISIATVIALILVPIKLKKKGKGKYILLAIIGILLLSIALHKFTLFLMQDPVRKLMEEIYRHPPQIPYTVTEW